MQMPNVNAVGIGYKVRDQQATQELAVVISVEKKVESGALAQGERVPPSLDGVPTDVVETGSFYALAEQTQRMRPAQPGLSIGQADEMAAGTFGCLVRRNGLRYMLSNNHVLGKSNQATLGSIIVQPAILDGGTSGDRIGRLDEFVPIAFEGAAPPTAPGGCSARIARLFGGQTSRAEAVNQPGANLVDCAIASPDDDAWISADILGIGAPKGAAAGTLGTPIQKSGRTTGYTTSQIVQIEVTVKVNYGSQVAVYANQLMAGAMSKPGDSGSAVLDMDGYVVGLLFAGSDTNTLLNPIQSVLQALQAEIDI